MSGEGRPGRKNVWFKHYNTASIGASFENLRATRDFETMACYWMLLELVSFHEDGLRGSILIPHARLHQYWNVSRNRAERIIAKIVTIFANTVFIENLDNNYKVSLANWSKLQETRGGKRDTKSPQSQVEVRSEILEERNKEVGGLATRSFAFREGKYFKQLSSSVQDFLIEAYGNLENDGGEFLNSAMLETENFIQRNEIKYIDRLDSFIPRNIQDKLDHRRRKRLGIEKTSYVSSAIGMVADL